MTIQRFVVPPVPTLVALPQEEQNATMAAPLELFVNDVDPDAVLQAAVDLIGRTIGTTRAWFGEINDALDTIDIIADRCVGVPGIIGKAPFRIGTPSVQEMLRDGVTVVRDSATADIEPEHREWLANDHTVAWLTAALTHRGRPVAMIGVSHDAPFEFTEEHVQLVREVGERTWQALLHARTLRRLREGQAALQRVNDAFDGDIDPEAVLALASETLGRAVGVTRAFYGEIDADREVIDIVMDWTDGIPSVRGEFPFYLSAEPVQQMLREGATVVEDVDAAPMHEATRAVNRANHSYAWIAVPLIRGGKPVALISVTNATPRSFTPADIALVREIGERTWQAVHHARTLRRLRQGQAALQRITDGFAQEMEPAAILAHAAETLGRALGANRACYGDVDLATDSVDIVMDWADGVPSFRGPFPFFAATPASRQMLREGATVVEDMRAADLPPEQIAVLDAADCRAWIAVPLMRGGQPVAMIAVTYAAPRTFTAADVELVRDIGERTWQAVMHASTVRRLAEHQHAIDARAGHERFFRALGDAIRDDTDDTTVLFKIATMLADHLDVDSASFSEVDPDDLFLHEVFQYRARPVASRTQHSVRMPRGIAAQMARLRDGRPSTSADADLPIDDELRAFLAEWQVASFITMPVVEGGRVVMMLGVQSSVSREWSEADVRLVRDLADRAWSSICRIRAANALAERERNQALLLAWNDAVRDATDPEVVIAETLSRLHAAFGFLSISFNELDPAGRRMEVIRVWQDGRLHIEPEGFDLDTLGPSPFTQATADNVLAVEDIFADPRIPPAAHAIYRRYGVGAVLIAPITDHGHPTAMIAMQSATPRRWTRSERQVLRDFADRVWTTLTRVRAEAMLAERERNQALLIAWSDAVRDETDPEAVIAETLARLGESFALRNVSFSELDPTGTLLENVRVWQDGDTYRDTRALPVATLGEALSRAFLDRASVAVDDVFADPRIPPASHALYREHGVGALLAAPIVSGDRVVALLAMQAAAARHWSASERGVLRELADRVWSKIERTRSEVALTRSRRALGQSEKMASIGAVLAGISHELNNPLAIVTAQAQLIAHIADGSDLAERARRVHEAGDRCARIIQSFLAVARQTPPARERAEIAPIIEGAVRQAAGDDDDRVLLRIDADLPEILVDADQIHQLLVNLIVNARHAVAALPADRRTVVVRAGTVETGVFVDVTDAGPGVPMAVRDRIFEPFFTTKETGHGTGMGLALAQGIAELHGGALVLMPTASGAQFRLTLPAG